jgi:hypothetical protein
LALIGVPAIDVPCPTPLDVAEDGQAPRYETEA